ncbi:hypothetical protein ACF0H5_003792 [Mactra antiquata]
MTFSVILIAIVFVNGAFPGKYEWYDDKKLDNAAFATFTVGNKVACVTLCNTEFYCGYAVYSTISGGCSLISTGECGVFVDAPQWIVYKRSQVDIACDISDQEDPDSSVNDPDYNPDDYLEQNGAVLTANGANPNTPLSNSVDGNLYTAFAANGADAWWDMDFGDSGVWPVARIHVEYDRYYNMNLQLNVSGVIFDRIGCSGTSRYAVQICRYKPPNVVDGCWANTSSIHITKSADNLTLKLYRVMILS